MRLKAGLNKIVLQMTTEQSDSKITLPEHLKTKNYIVLDVGGTRSTWEHPPTFVKAGDTVHLAPNSGFTVKDRGSEYVVCNYEDILAVCEN
jgi:co-chaperonin GroES (HSP10)